MEEIVEEFDWNLVESWVRYASVKCFGSPDFDDMNIIATFFYDVKPILL